MSTLPELFQRLRANAAEHHHRRLLLISGRRDWCYAQVNLLGALEDSVWIGSDAPGGWTRFNPRQTHKLLGQSYRYLVYDAWSGFNPDSFGQASGTLRGGGVLLLLCPDLDHWPEYDDPEHEGLVAFPYQSEDAGRRFISRMVMLLEDDAYTLQWREGSELAGVEIELPVPQEVAGSAADVALPSKTRDQQQAVELILNQLRRGRRPAVLTADRGRGKSTALGIAAAQLSGLDYLQILITAPEQASAEEAFHMAGQLLPDYQQSKGLLEKGEHSIRFLEPEQALSEPGEGQVLLVDEAAAIPVPVLSALLQRFPRIVFASTIHGYEGTGQGFSLRFKKVLDSTTPNWKSIHLNQPIRWAEQDPLEQLVFNLLLLNAEAADSRLLCEKIQQQAEQKIERLDRDRLSEDYETLNQLFGLLVLAHYRTTPGDLRILLDSPNLHIWTLRLDGQIAAAALISEEGPIPAELVEPIWSGERRPRGHLLPQTLLGHEGARAAAPLRAGRIMRIAVHPALQRQGLGSQLLAAIKEDAAGFGWDYLGASFAASASLQQFWRHAGFSTVRLGSSRDSVSGCHAALVIAARSEAASRLQQQLSARFSEQLSYRLSDDLTDLEPDLICELLRGNQLVTELSEHDHSDLQAFARHHRSYESCAYAIHRFCLTLLSGIDEARLMTLLQNADFCLLLERNLQQKSWGELERRGQGRKQLVRQLRQALIELLPAQGSNELNISGSDNHPSA
ncbi:tRNA(Met) cytidine acetyltransferase TmcA [Neptuniibacter halophilus]|uniref:tRNA(Met) cytidine acetyltransferase TmcA n=1 Tax=Neptuniibacter halophilus TaxID=651666 RepID=UPI002574050A|nr:GNAT family N-acetyltransferase [Neptuniibacter halophilus]